MAETMVEAGDRFAPVIVASVAAFLPASKGYGQNMDFLGPYGGLEREQKFCTKIWEPDLHNGKGDRTTTRVTYGTGGRITSVTVETVPPSTARTTYSYEPSGNYTTETFSNDKLTARKYHVVDKVGRVLEVQGDYTMDGGARLVFRYDYDAHGRVFRSTSTELEPMPGQKNKGRRLITERTLVYDGDDVVELTGKEFRGVKRHFSYGPGGQPRIKTVLAPNGAIVEFHEYLFDPGGRMVAQIGRRPGPRPGVPASVFYVVTMAYDTHGNLVSEIEIGYFRELTRTTYTYECWPPGKVPLIGLVL